MTPAVYRVVIGGTVLRSVLVAPIAEEILFSALLQRRLQRWADERWVQDGDGERGGAQAKAATRYVNLMCSIIFGLAHVPMTEVVASGWSARGHINQLFVATFASLLVYSPLYTKHGLLASTVAHMAWNAFATVYLFADNKVLVRQVLRG